MKKTSPYQAIVFAGGSGSRMVDLTTSIPKCLLPVANRPMVWYPLNYLESAGFSEAIVIVPAKCLAEVQRLISSEYRFTIKVDLFGLPPDQESCGTADALRMIADRIHTDIVLLSCDFITDFSLNDLLTEHQVTDASVMCLFSPNAVHGSAPGPKSKRKVERDIVAIVPEEQRIAFMASEDDLDEDTLAFSKNWLVRFPKAKFTTKLTDCHVYVMKKWIVELVKQNEELSSVKADFLPYLISLQYSKTSESELQRLNRHEKIADQSFEYSHSSGSGADQIRCLAYVTKPEQATFYARLNNYGSYFEANKQIVKSFPKWFSQPSAVPSDCVVAQSAAVQGQIKRSVIGKNSVVAEKAKITNSLLMDCVRIGSGATITNSIICHSADIGEKAEVKDSIVGMNQQVITLGRVVSEIIGPLSQMMDI